MRNPKLIDKLRAQLPATVRQLLGVLLDSAERRSLPLFLVGGPLRDLLLDRPVLDIDIAIEGDAVGLAREVAEAAGTRAIAHPAFGTATLRADGAHLDLITARSESYARPGALPAVRPGTIHDDLLRRDFTINALALRLDGPHRGEVLDPAGGLRDLDSRLVRVLHERSFQDDATRILRAFRYAARLGFEIDTQTLEWLKRGLPYLETISGARIHHEFARILAEDEPERELRALYENGVLASVHPGLRFESRQAEAFARLRELHPTGARAAYWPVLAWGPSEAEAASLARRLAATKPQREAMLAMPALRSLEPDLEPPGLRRSEIAEMLGRFFLQALWAFAALMNDATVRDRLLDYLTKARHERPLLTGDDLIALSVPRGPEVGEIIRRLRNARLDGEVASRQDEERLVRSMHAGSTPEKTPVTARPEALEG